MDQQDSTSNYDKYFDVFEFSHSLYYYVLLISCPTLSVSHILPVSIIRVIMIHSLGMRHFEREAEKSSY